MGAGLYAFGDDLPLSGMALREWDADPAYKYTGQRQVAGIGLYYYGARFYDPELGRFITEDTYAGALGDAQTQNRYCYVLNNPMRYTDPDGHKAQDYQVDNASDWRLVLGVENVDPEWEFSNYGDYIYCNSAGQYLHSRVTKVDGSTRIVNTYLTANGHFDHQEIKIYDLGSSQPRIYDDYVLAELTQQMLAQNLPKVAGSVALLIATTLCEPLDWGVTIYGWTQGDFSYWDMIGLFPGISAQVVDKVSDGAKVVMNVVRNSECAEVVMKVFRAGDGYVDEFAEGASEVKKELRRPYIRKNVRQEVELNTPKTADGKFIDPNTGLPIEGNYDLGHKPGNEFWREKAKAQSEGLTQKEFNDRMNNPDYYQIEDPSSNRSHKYEMP